MKKLVIILSALIFLLTGSSVLAQSPTGTQQCQPIYGGGETCVQSSDVTINSFVKNPQSNDYVDNLGIQEVKYAPSQVLGIKIQVTNTSDKKLSNLPVSNIFPTYTVYKSGNGKYDKASNTLTFTTDLNPSQSKTFYLEGQIVSKDSLPADQGAVCVINQAIAKSGDKRSQDNSQICIERNGEIQTGPGVSGSTKGGTVPSASPDEIPPTTKGGLPVYPPEPAQSTPPTGPGALALFSLIPAGLLGLYLRRKV